MLRPRHALVGATAAFALVPATAAAQAPNAIDVPTAEGYAVHVEFTDAAGGLNPELAAAYVGFLDSLPHGPELAQLKIQIASSDQVAGLCGGLEREGILACYQDNQNRMTVPNAGLDATTGSGTYSLRYVLTHEYGHHIALHRRGAGFRGGASDWGPRRWASEEHVCALTVARRLSPGDEGARYRANPGENWAEAYARLTFPDQPWTFSPLLVPDPVALDAARRDVVEPWPGNQTATFTMPRGRTTQRFTVPISLDGAVTARVSGPRRAEVGVRLSVDGHRLGTSAHRGSTDALTRTVCKTTPTATMTLTTIRTGGRPGPVQLSVSYPG